MSERAVVHALRLAGLLTLLLPVGLEGQFGGTTDPVAGFTVTAAAGKLEVTWSANSGVDKYVVEWREQSQSGFGSRSSGDLSASATSYDITGLSADSSYHVRVSGYDVQDTGLGVLETKTHESTTSSAVSPLSGSTTLAVTGLKLTAAPESLFVAWDALTGADSVKVEWKSTSAAEFPTANVRLKLGTATGDTIAGLTNGTEYTVRVSAKNSGGYGATVEDTGMPYDTLDAPANLTAEPGKDPETLAISWDQVPNATGYVLQWRLTSEMDSDYDDDRKRAIAGGEITKGDLGPLDTLSHTLRVQATDVAHGISGTWATTTGTPEPVPTPEAPKDVEVKSQALSLEVSWTAADHASRYIVEWKKSTAASYDRTAHADTTADTSHEITGLLADTAYNVRVFGVNKDGDESSASAEATGTPAAHPIPGMIPRLRVASDPNAPQLGVRFSLDANTVTYVVAWRKDSESTYPDANRATQTTSDPNFGTILLSNLDAATKYWVRIHGENAGGVAGPADTASATTCCGTDVDKVEGVELTAIASGLRVSFTPVTDATHYLIRYRTGTDAWTEVKVAIADLANAGQKRSYDLSPLTPSVSYRVQVAGRDESQAPPKQGDWSEEVLALSGAPPFGSIDVSSLTWNPLPWGVSFEFPYVVGATDYLIQWRSATEEWSTDRQIRRLTNSEIVDTRTRERGPEVHDLVEFEPSTEYGMRIAAFDFGGNRQGPWTDEITVTTGEGVPPPQVYIYLENHPRAIRVSWDPVRYAESYEIAWRQIPHINVTRATVEGGETTEYTITGLEPGRYGVRVRGVNSVGPGPLSLERAILVRDINYAPDAHNDFADVRPNAPVLIDVLANDTDRNNDRLSVKDVTLPRHGSATIRTDSIFLPGAGRALRDWIVYDPAPDLLDAIDEFEYTVTDGFGGEATARVGIRLWDGDERKPNEPPTATDDSASVTVGASVGIRVLDNDEDPTNDPLSIAWAGVPANGWTTIGADSIVYTPYAGFLGQDRFDYEMLDDRGGVDTATVYVEVMERNREPFARADLATTPPDSAIEVPALENDNDPDGSQLRISWIGIPSHGRATISADSQRVRYVPEAGYRGADQFEYRITDVRGATAFALITVTVQEGNAPPNAADDAAEAIAGERGEIDVLANDTDPNGDVLRVAWVSEPGRGVAEIDLGSRVVYTPMADYEGTDEFLYETSDGRGGADTATVRVTIRLPNAVPEPAADSIRAALNTAVSIPVLENDADADGDSLWVAWVDEALHGEVRASGDRLSILYTPRQDYLGTDRFGYEVTDGRARAWASVTVTVFDPNLMPVAEDDEAFTVGDSTVVIDVLANDSDPDGDSLRVRWTAAAPNGFVEIAEDSLSVTYTASPDFSGTDSFGYSITDGRSGVAWASVTVTVEEPNRLPVAEDDEWEMAADTLSEIQVLENDMDPDGDPLVVSEVLRARNGSAWITEDNQAVVYAPDPGYVGDDSFDYVISDGRAADTASVHVTIRRSARMRINDANRLLLPEITRTMLDMTTDGISRRIDAAFSGSSQTQVRVGGAGSMRGLFEGPGRALAEGRFDPDGVLSSSSVFLSGGKVSFWAHGGYRSLYTNGADLPWEGEIRSVQGGIDIRLRHNILLGVSGFAARSEFMYDGYDPDEAGGWHDVEMGSVNPYLAWKPVHGFWVWGTGGYGTGRLDVTDGGVNIVGSSWVTQITAAAGTRGVLRLGPAHLGLNSELSRALTWTTESFHLDSLELDVHRIRLAADAGANVALGAVSLSPSLEVGVRRDGGDGTTGMGREVGAGLRVATAFGLVLEGRARHMLAGELGYRETALGASVMFDPGAAGGLALRMGHGLGDPASRVRRIWEGRYSTGSPESRSAVGLAYSLGTSRLGLEITRVTELGVALRGSVKP